MKKVIVLLTGVWLVILVSLHISCNKYPADLTDYSPSDTGVVAHPDHIIFVWFENKGFNKIIGSGAAPYINSLVRQGTLFTNTYALIHPSYPNYVAFFSGHINGITSDACISSAPLNRKNLFTELKSAGKTFAWYSEGLPSTGSRVCKSGNYVEKHNPVTIFSTVPDSINKPFSSFPTDFSRLENVVCISPDLSNDMHDGSIEEGDEWLRTNLSSLADWCMSHNSIFVVYFDETETDNDNRIPVVAVGQPVKLNYESAVRYDHYSWTKTISSMFHANESWTGNLSRSRRVTDCWK
jgi:acid phosphatase